MCGVCVVVFITRYHHQYLDQILYGVISTDVTLHHSYSIHP